MAEGGFSPRTWLPLAVVALVALCGLTVLCGLAGIMALARSRPASLPSGESGTVLASSPSPSPSPTPVSPFLPFIEVGSTYRVQTILAEYRITVSEIGEGGWIRANVTFEGYPVGQGWLNLNHAWLVQESEP